MVIVKKGRWSFEEDQVLKENYQTKGSDWCACTLKRKQQAIWDRAKTLGIQRTKASYQWSKDDIQFTKNNYSTLGPTKIAKKLGRSSPAVSKFAKIHNLRKRSRKIWPIEDTTFLFNNYRKLGVAECSRILGRTLAQCYGHYSNKKLLNKKPEKCFLCSWDRGTLDSAHLIPGRTGGPKLDWNVVHLCPNCHRLFDHGLLKTEEMERLRPLLKQAEEKLSDN